jgi:hypothetical protein
MDICGKTIEGFLLGEESLRLRFTDGTEFEVCGEYLYDTSVPAKYVAMPHDPGLTKEALDESRESWRLAAELARFSR